MADHYRAHLTISEITDPPPPVIGDSEEQPPPSQRDTDTLSVSADTMEDLKAKLIGQIGFL